MRHKLPRVRLVLGNVVGVDMAARTCTAVDVEGRSRVLHWDRLVITSGSVTRLLSIPGVGAHAKGFKSIAEAVFLRDHVLRERDVRWLLIDVATRVLPGLNERLSKRPSGYCASWAWRYGWRPAWPR